MKINKYFKLAISIALPLTAGAIGSIFTAPVVQSIWYMNLFKPALNPPSWIFGPVWTTLFILMGISFFLVWSYDTTKDKEQHSNIRANVGMLRIWRWGIFLFFLQLILNTFWSIIFFALQSPGGALIEIIFLWLSILATIIVFAKISRPAAWLLVPYILWVSFAGYLNYAIWTLN